MNKKHSLAIEMRYEGKKYSDIAKKVDSKEQTVRKWFMVKGKLKDDYDSYERDENLFRAGEAKKVFRRDVVAAAKTLSKLLKSEDHRIRINAAKEILCRELGDAKNSEPLDDRSDKVDAVEVTIVNGDSVQTRKEPS